MKPRMDRTDFDREVADHSFVVSALSRAQDELDVSKVIRKIQKHKEKFVCLPVTLFSGLVKITPQRINIWVYLIQNEFDRAPGFSNPSVSNVDLGVEVTRIARRFNASMDQARSAIEVLRKAYSEL